MGEDQVEGRIADSAARDPKTLRALAHPLRWSLIEVLLSESVATATRCSELLGEPVNSCSYHLRTLEKYGYTERVETSAGRDRPWRLVEQTFSWETAGDDATIATDELNEMLIDREADRQRAFLRGRAQIPLEWRRAAAAEGAFRWMTPEELVAVNQEIETVFERYRERHDRSLRPADARLVRLISVTLPMPENAAATAGSETSDKAGRR